MKLTNHSRLFRGAVLVASLGFLTACNKVGFSAVTKPTTTGDCVSGDCGGGGTGDPGVPNTRPVVQTVTVKSKSKVDILFVVDSSGSMDKERRELGNRLTDFISHLDGIDWQICVTTTDVTKPAPANRLLKFNNNSVVLKSTTPGADSIFLHRMSNISSGSGDEQGIYSMNLAFYEPSQSCFRKDAALATVVLSDEDERSAGGHLQYKGKTSQYKELGALNMPTSVPATVKASFGADKVFTSHSIVVPSGNTACYQEQKKDSEVFYGTRYEELSQLTGGSIGNICATNYASQLQEFSDRIANSVDSVVLECAPVGAIAVDISPSPGVHVNATVTGNRVEFSPKLEDDAVVSIRYNCAI